MRKINPEKYVDMFGIFCCIIINLILVVVGVLIIGNAIKNAQIPEKETISMEQYCVVEDKYTKTVMIGKTPSVKHCIAVYVTDSVDLKDTIVVPNSIYNEIEVGMEIKCVITYTEDELVNIEFVSQ